ncbi:hypothetical protein D9V30_08795 [Mycetocola reblochoni]|uniref:DUF4352 domain-containing protein n=2 Tax=Mycetocola reblochoni TaxID=331618 RepID=A0A1R4IG95_9MICO|nr:hypothetical protein D9V30_08795 [Mycetocola reblochoni]SJN18796.1 hypothetical protein FM119_01630 [Mycetocola reblochoni REB411]
MVIGATAVAVGAVRSEGSGDAEAQALATSSATPSSSASDEPDAEPSPSGTAVPESGRAGGDDAAAAESARDAEPSRGPDNPFPERPSVEVGATTDLGDGLTVAVTSIDRIEGEAQGIGEIGGPAVRATVEVVNSGPQAQSLAGFAVNAFLGTERVPAGELTGSGAQALPAEVGAGKTVTGRYVFSVPDDSPAPVVISVDTDPSSPLVIVPMS